ncbi:MAG: hypothetical protein KDK36_00205, partial [Leptospiraceae bacterium]|nr:hypothetical protein [Leptospiraceae bacterium]
LNENISTEDYIFILGRWLNIYRTYLINSRESYIRRILEDQIINLENDLISIQGNSTYKNEQLPICIDTKNEYSEFGVRYVLQGSLLGGQLIVKMLSKSKELKIVNNLKFYSNNKSNVMESWKEFKSLMNGKIKSESDYKLFLEASRSCFRDIIVCLDMK